MPPKAAPLPPTPNQATTFTGILKNQMKPCPKFIPHRKFNHDQKDDACVPCQSYQFKFFRTLSIIAMIVTGGFAIYLYNNGQDHTDPPEFKPYEYLRRRTRDDGGFPWGKESLFFNPRVNVSKSQYDEVVESLSSKGNEIQDEAHENLESDQNKD